MRSNRDAILQAIFTLLQNAAYPFTIVTSSRDMTHWDQVVSDAQPALFLQQGPQEATQEGGGQMALNRWLLLATAWVYFRRNTVTVASTTISQVQDAIDDALLPVPGQRQTLGGLVTNVRIKSFGDQEGVLDQQGGQALVWAELEVLVNDRQGPV